MQRKPVILVVISFLTIALIFGSFPTFVVQGKPVFGASINCKEANFFYETCCWWDDEYSQDHYTYVCQTCYDTDGYGSNGYEDCDPPEDATYFTPTPPISPPKGPLGTILPGGDVLQELEQTPPSPPRLGETVPEAAPPTAPEADEEGTSEVEPLNPPKGPIGDTAPQIAPPTAEDGSGLPTTEPPCPESQILDEETGLCVLEEPEAAESPVGQPPTEEEQQPAEEEDGSEDNSNN